MTEDQQRTNLGSVLCFTTKVRCVYRNLRFSFNEEQWFSPTVLPLACRDAVCLHDILSCFIIIVVLMVLTRRASSDEDLSVFC